MSLSDAIVSQNKQPLVGIYLAPQVALLPLSIQRFDDPFLPFGKAVINASRDRASLYIFDVVAYLALGGAGAVALERTIDYLNDEVPCVLHGAFGSANFTQLLDKLSFGATAITVNRDEKIVLVDSTKQAVGEWQIEQGRLQLYNSDLVLKIYGSELVYKSRREDFQDVIRQGLV